MSSVPPIRHQTTTVTSHLNRAIAFWQYQIHQENTFQQAVLRNLNDKNSQLQKQLDSVVREANSEIALLNNKRAELERDLEVEKRKVRDLQEANRESEKEYQKLKTQLDKIKRKTVLAPSLATNLNTSTNEEPRAMKPFPPGATNTMDIGAVVGGMEANGIQRTPLVNRTGTFQGFQPRVGRSSSTGSGEGQVWAQPALQQQQHAPQRGWARPGNMQQPTNRRSSLAVDPSARSGYISDRSDSANEVENLLVTGDHGPSYTNRISASSGWQAPPNVQRPRPSAGAQPQRSGSYVLNLAWLNLHLL
ncbi:hypothetical protein V5O48_008233 [Marasmius crinis-equi]|uniref:Uncharacterized protein n=1 Tax=Marasmius crinis-equi TaxID=585013 RepID=A0ABR3FEP4_9AGAR